MLFAVNLIFPDSVGNVGESTLCSSFAARYFWTFIPPKQIELFDFDSERPSQFVRVPASVLATFYGRQLAGLSARRGAAK